MWRGEFGEYRKYSYGGLKIDWPRCPIVQDGGTRVITRGKYILSLFKANRLTTNNVNKPVSLDASQIKHFGFQEGRKTSELVKKSKETSYMYVKKVSGQR